MRQSDYDTGILKDTDHALWGDMAAQILRVKQFVADRPDSYRCLDLISTDDLKNRFGFRERRGKEMDMVPLADMAVELGHPSTKSLPILLVTDRPGSVDDGAIGLIGPDLQELSGLPARSIAQVVMLQVDASEPPDPFRLDTAQFPINRLPGYMLRSIPGRLWVRVSKAAIAAGLSFSSVGSALHATYTGEFHGVIAMESLFVTASDMDVEALKTQSQEAAILAGRHKKLSLGIDGEIECSELNCSECEEKPVCDNLRDVVVRRRGEHR